MIASTMLRKRVDVLRRQAGFYGERAAGQLRWIAQGGPANKRTWDVAEELARTDAETAVRAALRAGVLEAMAQTLDAAEGSEAAKKLYSLWNATATV